MPNSIISRQVIVMPGKPTARSSDVIQRGMPVSQPRSVGRHQRGIVASHPGHRAHALEGGLVVQEEAREKVRGEPQVVAEIRDQPVG